jgi:hypothetical protein
MSLDHDYPLGSTLIPHTGEKRRKYCCSSRARAAETTILGVNPEAKGMFLEQNVLE